MSTRNSLICFTNCKLALEDGSIVERDLWIDEAKGVVADAQVRNVLLFGGGCSEADVSLVLGVSHFVQ